LHDVIHLIDPAFRCSDNFLREHGIGHRSIQSGRSFIAVRKPALAVAALARAVLAKGPFR
jgi:hypothetical protein